MQSNQIPAPFLFDGSFRIVSFSSPLASGKAEIFRICSNNLLNIRWFLLSGIGGVIRMANAFGAFAVLPSPRKYMAKKLQLSYKEIESRLQTFKSHPVPASEVGYEILKAFGKSDRDISRYKEGKGILKTFDGLLIKGLFCYRAEDTMHLTEKLESLKHDTQVLKAAPKIIAVSDGQVVLAYDTREKDTYEQQLSKMHSDFGFFWPLTNVERVHVVAENPADVKAAEKLAKLHDEIRAYNEYNSDDDLHDLNIFITRLLFCFFAEDTGIFAENLFTNFIRQFTKDDGSDLSDMIGMAFHIMNVHPKNRGEEVTKEINQFPYVNGGLFATDIPIPQMGYKARKIIIECGDLDWKDINPDIFGSMIQAVVNPDVRAKEGMHYTSVPNIMKVINPLFMDDLRAEFRKLEDFYAQKKNMRDMGMLSINQMIEECKPVIRGCDRLMLRMSKMKFFDPACGSGNFLIITYKQLRLLEMDILHLRKKCQPEQMLDFIDGSCIHLDQFYGIELLDFPHEVAMLSLWLAEHQMNNKFHADFGVNVDALPLKNIDQIKCGNACRLDWEEVCPHTKEEEVFVFGNPPYLGTKWQTSSQKGDVDFVMPDNNCRRTLDYISCWFILGAKYIRGSKARYAFVSTNSICQGEQVAALWSNICKYDVCIEFCYLPFKWSNNAKYNAGVTCVIIGLGWKSQRIKLIYADKCKEVNNINYYLLDAPNVIVEHRSRPLSAFPVMRKGSQPTDGGFLLMDTNERNAFVSENEALAPYIRQYMGADDLINGKLRYCLWLKDCPHQLISSSPKLMQRLEEVAKVRRKSSKELTRKWALKPQLFTEDRQPDSEYLMLPVVSSERRKYIPMAYNDSTIIANTNSQMIPNAPTYIFGVLTSLIHSVWMKAVCGRLEMRYAYSASVVYNTFPFPSISSSKKSEIENAAENILLVRAAYPEKTLADLYDPDKMPQDLREAHETLDTIVESCYPGAPFANDEARLECLFKLYEKMIANKK